jgi:hypothetical protein
MWTWNSYLHNYSISRLDADDLIKRGGDKRAMQDQTSPLFEMIVTWKWFLHVCKQDIIEILKDEYMVWNIIFIYHHVKYNSYVCSTSWFTKSCSIGDSNFKFTFNFHVTIISNNGEVWSCIARLSPPLFIKSSASSLEIE